MDRATLAAYDNDAAAFAQDWHEQPAPVDLQDIIRRFFIKGGVTADIGCGSGREVAWLNAMVLRQRDSMLPTACSPKRASAIRISPLRMPNCPIYAAWRPAATTMCSARP
jgi:hypothetical protein